MRRPLIYVCGPLSEPSPLEYIDNLTKMNDEAEYLYEQGWAPIVPGNDLLLFYRTKRKWKEGEILEVDAAIIRACYAMRVRDEFNKQGNRSVGVAFEIDVAIESGVWICRTRREAKKAYNAWRLLHS